MIICTSLPELDRHLAAGQKEDVFRYDGPDRTVRLDNDCRTYPLRLRTVFRGDDPESQVLRFVQWCRAHYGIAFSPYLEGAFTSRIPGIAPKVMAFLPLGEAQVHFYKKAARAERRRVVHWMVGRRAAEPA